MKKILSLCLVICLICMASVSASAAENLKICGESYSIFSSSISEAVATKNMRTGEVSFPMMWLKPNQNGDLWRRICLDLLLRRGFQT